MTDRWRYGEIVTRREFLKGRPWCGFATYVVEDTAELLAVYLATGSELSFADWPLERWAHPWHKAGFTHWQGHGKLVLQRPGEPYAVELFWRGDDRDFAGWYLNLQDPVRRWSGGFDTLDHELDYWIEPTGQWHVKDAELFEYRVVEGRYSAEQGDDIRQTGRDIAAMLAAGATWWEPGWAEWKPPPEWTAVDVTPDWASFPPA